MSVPGTDYEAAAGHRGQACVVESVAPSLFNPADGELRARLEEQVRELTGRLHGANTTAREAIGQLRAAQEREAALRVEHARLSAYSEERDRLLTEVQFLRDQLHKSREAEEQLRTCLLGQSGQLPTTPAAREEPALPASGLNAVTPRRPDAVAEEPPAPAKPWWMVSERPPAPSRPWWKWW